MAGRRKSDAPRKKTICVRVTEAEDAEINAWLVSLGAPNASDVIRRMIFDAISEHHSQSLAAG